MPHSRARHLVPLLVKKLRFSPVVAIQGARQTGKSFLAREILPAMSPGYTYVTFDEYGQRDFASRNPDTYLAQKEGEGEGTLAIDEAQKVPDLFDAIKLNVDKERRPGRYLLLGSTEFSKLTRIRESLTGRMSRVRLYPLNAAESLGLGATKLSGSLIKEKPRLTRSQMMAYLDRGGFPGIFAVRDSGERRALLQDWLDLTVERDVLQMPGVKVDTNLCLEILRAVATLDEPDAAHIARHLKKDARRVKTHINVLKTLFVLHELMPHRLGTGKPMYFLLDVALAGLLGADFRRRIVTWALHEQLSQRAYADDRMSRLTYYRNTKGSFIHLVIENADGVIPVKILDSEKTDEREFLILKAFREKNPGKTFPILLGAARHSFKKEKIEIYPWESLA